MDQILVKYVAIDEWRNQNDKHMIGSAWRWRGTPKEWRNEDLGFKVIFVFTLLF